MGGRLEHRRSFSAVGKDGSHRILHVYVSILDARTFDDPTAEVEGLMELRTDDDLAVNRIEKGVYEIVITGERLTSDDPEAL